MRTNAVNNSFHSARVQRSCDRVRRYSKQSAALSEKLSKLEQQHSKIVLRHQDQGKTPEGTSKLRAIKQAVKINGHQQDQVDALLAHHWHVSTQLLARHLEHNLKQLFSQGLERAAWSADFDSCYQFKAFVCSSLDDQQRWDIEQQLKALLKAHGNCWLMLGTMRDSCFDIHLMAEPAGVRRFEQ